MSFISSFSVLPSFKNHHDIEFCRQLLLNQIPNALLFFDSKSKIIHDFIIVLLRLPGNDPIRDVPIILFKWRCRCFYNRMKPPVANPSVPLDFSFTHPELVNFEVLYSYASNENLAENLLRLNDTFPYELFKVISNMKPENAQIFATACGFNSKIPIHMSGRIISIFPLPIVTIDYSKIFRKRCYKSYNNLIDFFEGLLCNADFNISQITAAQLLSDHFDDLLIKEDDNSNNNENKNPNDQYLQLINTSIRKMEHFLDSNLALSMHLFPSQCTTLSFLLQTSAAPFSTLSKAIKKLPPSEYITRFNNQLKLMQVIGLGEDWEKLEEHSIPYLIGPGQLSLVPVILVDIPRTSRFLTLQSSDYQRDYDFIQAYLLIESMIANQKITSKDSIESLLSVSDSLFSSKSENSFLSNITTDLFSLLFLKKKNINNNYDLKKNDYFDVLGRRKSNSLSSFTDFISNCKFSPLSKSGSTNYLMNPTFSEFLFDADTALTVVTLLKESGKASEELQPFLERALIRIRCAMSLFERPVRMEAVLLPQNYFYLQALTSLELLDMLIKYFGNPPSFVTSRQFTLIVSRSLFLRDRSAAVMISTNNDDSSITITKQKKSFFNPFSDRISNDKPLNSRTEEVFNDVLKKFPSNLHSLLILDFVSSRKKFTILAKKNKDERFNSFVKKLLAKSQRYPNGSTLDLLNSKSLNDLQKKLCSILSFGKNILTSFCAFLFLLTTIPSQSYSKFLTDPIEEQIVNVINDADTIQSVVERFDDTGIDVLKIIFKMKNLTNLKEKLIVELVKFEPLFGVPFSLNTTVNKNKITEIIKKKDNFKIVTNYLNEKNASFNDDKSDTLSSLLNEDDENKFNQTFEEKVDRIIHDNKVILLLQKLDSKSAKYQFKSMMILDYLIFKVNLSPHFELILSIISNCPKEWSIQFLESFISLVDPSNEMLMFPLQQHLSELKPLPDYSQMTEAMKVQSSWDYLIKEATRFRNVIEKPEKFYRLCSLHLMSHEVGHSLIILVQSFTQILLYVRSYRIFAGEDGSYSRELEMAWIAEYLKHGISSLKEDVLAEMVVDIGLNYDYECGLSISRYFSKSNNEEEEEEETKRVERTLSTMMVNLKVNSSISEAVKKRLPLSIYLVNYVDDPHQLVTEILSEKVVSSIEKEEELLHLLVKMKSFEFIQNDTLYSILSLFTHIGVFSRFGITYSGSSISGLRDVAELCDLFGIEKVSLEKLFEGVEVSETVRRKLDASYSILGFIPSRSSAMKKLLGTIQINEFDCENFLNDAFSNLKEKVETEKVKENKKDEKSDTIDYSKFSIDQIISSINNASIQSFKKSSSFTIPNILSISADGCNLAVFYEPLDTSASSSSSGLKFHPDFKFFDIECKTVAGEAQLRVSSDSRASVTETIAFSEVKTSKREKKRKFFTRNDENESMSDFVLFNAVHSAVVASNLFDLFDALTFDEMKKILFFANDKSLVFFLLQVTIWVQEHQDFLPIFVFPRSHLQGETQGKTNISSDFHKVLEFVLALKLTLLNAIPLADDVDPSVLFPPAIIRSGDRRRLDDLCLAIEHQLHIGVQNLNLFEETASTGNVAHVIAQVFVNYSNDYDRGFALTRVFHADIDEVMIEAAALVATKSKNSQEQLVQFLLAVLPRLDSRSSNQLIQALSSILVRNASNEHFLKLILAGIKNEQSSCQMLRYFGFSEIARDFALLNDIGDEVELASKDARKKGIPYAARICNRWILQHKQ
ncbi:hypothetical protein M9Y10_009084 [Tritrichomonas musculus]|uniref:HECT domain-containing protein n=1 Tax=Tritrichomonas musculus TaxID=1915356 RepID=A0ABR2IZW3_9EUKA